MTDFAIHTMAAARTPRPQRRRPEPVETVRIDPEVLRVATQLAACPCKIRLCHDGSVLIANQHKPTCERAA